MEVTTKALTDIEESAEALAEMMRGKQTVVVSGAGMSTDSGLPDYRGTGTTQEPSVEYDDAGTSEVLSRTADLLGA